MLKRFLFLHALVIFASVANAQVESLSESDARVWNIGPITPASYVTGGIVGSVIGFGVGHSIQGRYSYDGSVYTVGEGASLALFAIGRIYCLNVDSEHRNTCGDGLRGAQVVGMAAFIGFHLWEILDLWISPKNINDRYEELKNSKSKSAMALSPVMVSDRTPGIGMTFSF